MHKVLFIVNHRKNRSPGQRYRFEQYISFLESKGYECVFSPLLMDAKEDADFYSTGNYLRKLELFLKGFYRRTKDVFRAKEFDIIFVFREAMMTGSTLFEERFKKSGAKIIFDFDDAIWLPTVSEGNKGLSWLKNPLKVNKIMQLSDLIFAGNQFIADYAAKLNSHVEIIPSTIDFDYYSIPSPNAKSNNYLTIGWSGSSTTIEHFETVIPVLLKLKEKMGDTLQIKVYGVPGYKNDTLGIAGIPWSPETEVQEIASFDIGIMPLPDNEWTRGKCGMKGLQYMALEVATIMSPVGVNKEIISDGENGLLASSEEEWMQKISLLIESKELRDKLGKAGKKTVIEGYSVASQKERYLSLFNQLVEQKIIPSHHK